MKPNYLGTGQRDTHARYLLLRYSEVNDAISVLHAHTPEKQINTPAARHWQTENNEYTDSHSPRRTARSDPQVSWQVDDAIEGKCALTFYTDRFAPQRGYSRENGTFPPRILFVKSTYLIRGVSPFVTAKMSFRNLSMANCRVHRVVTITMKGRRGD